MNAKLGWDTAVAASERLSVEVAQLRAENARLKAEIEALKPEGEKLRASIRWTREVRPGKNPESGGAVVHMTWDEFNAMRALADETPPETYGEVLRENPGSSGDFS